MTNETRQGVVDRIEDGRAVIYLGDDPEPLHFERKQLPKKVKAGDSVQLTFEGDQVIRITRDPAATQAARERIQSKVERLRRGDHLQPPKPAGDAEATLPGEGND